MLRHASEANPEAELAAWTGGDRPRFSFGLYERRSDGRTSLEIRDLLEYAQAIDREAGDGLLGGELEDFGGVTGIRTGRHGFAQFAYGLRVDLEHGIRGVRGIEPGGITAFEHVWNVEETGAEPGTPVPPPPPPSPAPQPAGRPPVPAQAQADGGQDAPAAPPDRPKPKSALNPLAQPFVPASEADPAAPGPDSASVR
jgi:hypothetical protein